MSRTAQRSVFRSDWLYLMIEANGDRAVDTQTGSAASDCRKYAGAVLLYDAYGNRKENRFLFPLSLDRVSSGFRRCWYNGIDEYRSIS